MNFLFEFGEGLLIAWDAVRANKLRSALTTLGIIIGIVSVTLMGAAMDGLNRSFHESVSTLGADVLFVDRISWFVDSWDEWIKEYKRKNITLEQIKSVERQLTLARAVAPVVQTEQSVRYQNHSASSVACVSGKRLEQAASSPPGLAVWPLEDS